MKSRRRRNFASNAAGKWNVRWPSASGMAFTVCTSRYWTTLRDGHSTAWRSIGPGVRPTCRNILDTSAPRDMIARREFHPLQAEEIARAFNEKGVDYLLSERVHAPGLRSASEVAGDTNAGPA